MSIVAFLTATLTAYGQCDTLRRDSLQRDTLLRDTLQRDTVVRDTVLRDTVVRDTIRRDSLQRDSLQRDTVLRETTRHDAKQHDTKLNDQKQRDTKQPETSRRDTVVPDAQRPDKSRSDSSLRDTVKRDTIQRDALQRDTILRETFQRDSLEKAITDSLRVVVRDSLRTIAPAVGVNLAWAGISAPNLSFELPLSDHFSLGISGGYKPWRRWSPLDWDEKATKKWAHFAVLPYLRWWPDVVFDGFFLEGDLIYSHYNVANIKLPFGLYPDIAENRLQGDFYGAGLSIGYSFWLTTHVNLTLAAGILAGYKSAVKYECPWCGGEVGRPEGLELVPRLDVSVAYHLFDLKRNVEKKLKAEKEKRD